MKQQYVQHRVNTAQALARADTAGGVEIDLRSDVHRPSAMHLSHDPWVAGEDFARWLEVYARMNFAGPLVVNTKEDGLEETILKRLQSAGIEHFFFLDTTPPTLVRLLSLGLGAHLCVRVSAWEPPAAAAGLLTDARPTHRPAWCWLDCFGGEPMSASTVTALRRAHPELNLCLVSPELQRAPEDRIPQFKALGALSTAVCTKRPDLWRATMAEAQL